MIARIRKSMQEKDQGFTLIELLVVMIIIGILAAIAVPVFLNQKKKAVDTSVKADLKSAAAQVETLSVDSGTYPTVTTAGTYGALSAASPAITSNVTTGNQILYTTQTGGFCLKGYNTDGNSTATSYYVYNSVTGGLKTVLVTSGSTAAGSC